jgi:cytosine/adenosine deaminase-related metal-dependent hydrolase
MKFKLHEAEWKEDAKKRAVLFTACMFLGNGHYERRTSKTYKDIMKKKDALLEEYKGQNYGRGVLVYAVRPDGVSVLLN